MRQYYLFILFIFFGSLCYSQSAERYSAVNPLIFNYNRDDIMVVAPIKYNNGSNIIVPQPHNYPWEAKLENVMPNVIVDSAGNTSIYISSFIQYSPTPPSKVGAMVYTNSGTNINSWERPNAGLYWYNPNGVGADNIISSTYRDGYKETNIVAVDIESVGIMDDKQSGMINLMYLPQRESKNRVLSSYSMNKSFNHLGVLNGFYQMKYNRQLVQSNYIFDYINGDTHMQLFRVGDKYYFSSRVNAKRSYLADGEVAPLSPDLRVRFRRATITSLGENLLSKKVDFKVALDNSYSGWEPYSLQPFRLEGFDNDILWGLVTMYGSARLPLVAHKQRTELAFSINGIDWEYLKPGLPFLDNGESEFADDYGCINIGLPVRGSKLSSDSTDLLYFYGASNIRHISGRNSGISLAVGKFGKMAGIESLGTIKSLKSNKLYLSLYKLMHYKSYNYPFILGDVYQSPVGELFNNLESYIFLGMYGYDSLRVDNKGAFLGGSFANSAEGGVVASNLYESATPADKKDIKSKNNIFKYLKDVSEEKGGVVALSSCNKVPIVMEVLQKNSTFYGFEFISHDGSVLTTLNSAKGGKELFIPSSLPAEYSVNPKTQGAIVVSFTPSQLQSGNQCIFNLTGDEFNYSSLTFSTIGSLVYKTVKQGEIFNVIEILPPSGESFINKRVEVVIEAQDLLNRKYSTVNDRNVTNMVVKCADLNFELSKQQDIIWNWKHDFGYITQSDSCNAQAFAHLEFTSFIDEFSKVIVGAKNMHGEEPFSGVVHKIQFSVTLPSGNNDFWN